MENENVMAIYLTETCVCCGAPIPEGRMTCVECEKKYEGLYLPLNEIKNKKRRKWFGKR